MTVYVYDGSFEGLLSCIFEAYACKETPVDIVQEQHHQFILLEHSKRVSTNDEFAKRVLTGLNLRSNDRAAEIIYQMYLSEQSNIEILIFNFIRCVMASNDATILQNFANEYILKAAKIEKMIHREVHRMHAFVRFQKAKEGIFYAAIEPDFNVIPLLGDHFERRYADQPWIIFDTKRHYGLHYDLDTTQYITLDSPIFNTNTGALQPDVMDEKEQNYQHLWENYFQSVNIKERKNIKLHIRHVPKRYWKYLIEKAKPR